MSSVRPGRPTASEFGVCRCVHTPCSLVTEIIAKTVGSEPEALTRGVFEPSNLPPAKLNRQLSLLNSGMYRCGYAQDVRGAVRDKKLVLVANTNARLLQYYEPGELSQGLQLNAPPCYKLRTAMHQQLGDWQKAKPLVSPGDTQKPGSRGCRLAVQGVEIARSDLQE